ncbi:ATPase P [Desulfovibrio sulfodismutans]|uniref:ATPase P n=1 Tax=Desulfolutivibrio sulfodismutans TaxID=63561 RepID=A0A7K3NNS7_9BACT|nr:ATPase P [Desulfolutivibrio sulfodismutans]NDY56849.1 ATPase P [Desulfolutivibrio sulfodismutans]QLA13886.1 ATPase P [Desulfolutivibrio sulfodismutans DSM 3696]
MLTTTIPGLGDVSLAHLVLDYNGTLALDGAPLPGVAERLAALADSLAVHVITADTFGTVRAALAGLPASVTVLSPGPEDAAKLAFVQSLGLSATASIGNGRNDRLMLRACAVGLAVIGPEGACLDAVLAADAVFTDIRNALDVFTHPARLVATLRT